jgi:uncharacterized surface protein with fasciclin (FAS1) repeats
MKQSCLTNTRNLLVNGVTHCLFACALLASFPSCEQAIDDEFRFTATDDQVYSFLKNDPETYSEFTALLDSAGMVTLLSARGYYTCFIPTNTALRAYYEEQETSLAQMTGEQRQLLAYTHLIAGSAPEDVISSDRFPNGSISLATMNDIFLEISIDTIPGQLLINVNKTAAIVRIDQKVHNGVIHTVDKVLEMISLSLDEKIEAEESGPYSLFYKALTATGLVDTLDQKVNNDLYDATRQAVTNNDFKIATKISYNNGALYETPAYCKYGFTVLRESDEIYKKENIETFEELVAYAKKAYPEGKDVSDYRDSRSSLYRFVAYHILDRNLFETEFIPNERYEYYTTDTLYEYVETLCSNTLMEISAAGKNGIVFNRRMDTKDGVRIISGNEQTKNSTLYGIDRILTYENVEEQVLNKRIRLDVASIMPELATNKIRYILTTGSFPGYIIVPQNYFKNLTYTESTQLHYAASSGWGDCEGDEFLFVGKYDFRLRIPPAPPGTYEVRIGYTANSWRAVSQLYLDGFPCGIPLDMKIGPNNAKIGWIKDSETEDNGAENDKMMRNRGYMKGPATLMMKDSKTVLRDNNQALRRIVATVQWNETKAHELRIKSVEDDLTREFHLDYIELAPSTIWETEGRD